MANWFELETPSYDGRYMYLYCTQTIDYASNSSTINWTLYSEGGNERYYSTGATSVKINGVEVYNSPRVQWTEQKFPAAVGSVSGTLKVAHNSAGEAKIAVSLTTAIYTTTLSTKSGTWTLDKITQRAYITNAPNFTDDDNPQITYSNAAGNAVTALDACISFTGARADIPYRAISKTGTTYTFNLTDAERQTLRAALTSASSMQVQFIVRTTISGVALYSGLTKTLSIANGKPLLNPTVEDVNATTVALTGDKTKLVRYHSNAAVKFNTSAVKGATLTKKEATNGATKLTADGTISSVQDAKFSFYVEDSRKLSNSVVINAPFVNYVKLTCNIANNKPDTEGKMVVEASGNYYSGSFGAASNSLTVYYRYTSGGTTTAWQQMQTTISGNTYRASYTVSGLQYQETYNFQCYAVDKLESVYSATISVRTTPIFDWGEEDFNFNVPVGLNGNTAIRATDTNRLVLSASGGDIFLRPNGTDVDSGQLRLTTDGRVAINGAYIDYVVEYGSTSDGYTQWEKWNSGKITVYGSGKVSSLGYYQVILPFAFASGNRFAISSPMYNGDTQAIRGASAITTTSAFANSNGAITIYARTDGAVMEGIWVSFVVYGYWK